MVDCARREARRQRELEQAQAKAAASVRHLSSRCWFQLNACDCWFQGTAESKAAPSTQQLFKRGVKLAFVGDTSSGGAAAVAAGNSSGDGHSRYVILTIVSQRLIPFCPFPAAVSDASRCRDCVWQVFVATANTYEFSAYEVRACQPIRATVLSSSG